MNKLICAAVCVIGYVLLGVALIEYFTGCDFWTCNLTLLASLALSVGDLIFFHKKVKK